jgi:hypothetical protein
MCRTRREFLYRSQGIRNGIEASLRHSEVAFTRGFERVDEGSDWALYDTQDAIDMFEIIRTYANGEVKVKFLENIQLTKKEAQDLLSMDRSRAYREMMQLRRLDVQLYIREIKREWELTAAYLKKVYSLYYDNAKACYLSENPPQVRDQPHL